jgi:hypothetical protein
MSPAIPFYMAWVIWCRNHGSVAPPDHGTKFADLIHFRFLKQSTFERYGF